MLNNVPDFDYVGASNIPMPGYSRNPRPLTRPEIKEYVDLFVMAAQNAGSGEVLMLWRFIVQIGT